MNKYILPEELKNKKIISITPIKNKDYGIIVKFLEEVEGKIKCSFYKLGEDNMILPINNAKDLEKIKHLYYSNKNTKKGFIEE